MRRPSLEHPPGIQFKILSEITDAVIVTDHEHHVLYWNGPAERLWGIKTEEILGRPLYDCCPDWGAACPAPHALAEELVSHGKWIGEIVARPGSEREVCLQCSVSVFAQAKRAPELLWIQRDVTEHKRLETELRRTQDLLHSSETRSGNPAEAPFAGRQDVVLWAEDDDDDAILLSRAWHQAQVNEQLVRVRDGEEVIRYLNGEGVYGDRRKYPAPTVLLLDIRMPYKSGLDVIDWLHTQPTLSDLPVVILTSSTAASDIREAARLGVKGYLVKPSLVSEWVFKVKTVTSQCR